MLPPFCLFSRLACEHLRRLPSARRYLCRAAKGPLLAWLESLSDYEEEDCEVQQEEKAGTDLWRLEMPDAAMEGSTDGTGARHARVAEGGSSGRDGEVAGEQAREVVSEAAADESACALRDALRRLLGSLAQHAGAVPAAVGAICTAVARWGMCCHPTNEFLLCAAIPLMSSSFVLPSH